MVDIFNPQVSVVTKGLEGKLILIYGTNRTGKTSNAVKANKPLVVGFERGLNAISGVPYVPIKNWNDWTNTVKQLTGAKSEEAKKLYQTIIVDTIDSAMSISRRVNRYRIVTLDGDVISPGGSMTGGQRNQRNNSPLQTATEINQLEKQLQTLRQNLAEDQERLDELVTQGEKVAAKLQQLRDTLQETNQAINEAAISFQNQEKEVKRLTDANSLYKSRVKEQQDILI